MDFLAFLEEVGAGKCLDINAAAQDGGCCLVFSESLEVTFEYDEKNHKVVLFASALSIGQWPVEARARILSQVLELHLFGLETEDSYFGFDPQLDRIIFFHSMALDGLETGQGAKAVESFVNQLERWQAHLVQLSQEQPAVVSSELPIERA